MMRMRRESAIKKILMGAQIPLSAIGIESRLELNGRREVVIEGCESVLEYTSERAVIRMCDGVVSLLGSEREMTKYGERTVTVSGRLDSISLLEK